MAEACRVRLGPMSVSPMGFGTWAWGNQFLWGYQDSMDTQLQQTFNLAVKNGINLVDTADSYGTGKLNGQSEKLLGNFISQLEGKRTREDIVIATKFAAYPWRLTSGQFVKALQGLVRAVGVSNYGPKQLVKIHDYLKARGVPLCSAQVQFSLLSMGEDQKEMKSVCDALEICIIAYSPLGLGMLTGKYTSSRLLVGPRYIEYAAEKV